VENHWFLSQAREESKDPFVPSQVEETQQDLRDLFMSFSTSNFADKCPRAMTPRWLPALLGAIAFADAATVTYDFEISWVTANPDGMANRPTIGINGQWPIPRIQADVGDRIIVNVLNSLGNQSTSLHFHGIFMNGTTDMDGPSFVTQCPIPPGARFTYNFTVEQPGTYWYHSHTHGQYPDGLRGPLIINDPNSPFKGLYDDELVMTVSDWYHDEMPGLLSFFMSRVNPTGAEPVPKSALLNETQNLKIPFDAGKTYLFRVINIGAFSGQYLWFEGHNMTILEVDGVYTHPAEATMIYLSAAQRCSFLVTAKNDTSANFPIVASMDTVGAGVSRRREVLIGIRTYSTSSQVIWTGTLPAGLFTILISLSLSLQCFTSLLSPLTTSPLFPGITRRSGANPTRVCH